MRKYYLPNADRRIWKELRDKIRKINEGNNIVLPEFIQQMLEINGVSENSAGAGPEYERFLARTKTVEQKQDWNVSGLKNPFLKDKLTLKVQKNIFDISLKLEDLFAEGFVSCLEPGVVGEVVMTRGQVRCLLSHMLLCTLTRGTWHKHWVTLQPWIVRDNKPCVSYLSCLMDYFENDDIDLAAEIKFKRLNLDLQNAPQWQDSTQPLVKCEVVCPSHIGRQDHREVEVDFANKDIGYGPGGTQEEILFGMTPEACPAVLICPTLQDNESLLISGVERAGSWSGYGWEVSYSGQGDRLPRTILCMDALELDDSHPVKAQAHGKLLEKELVKCLSGFSSLKDRTVATGAWGCGAFGGDKDVKFVIQLASASMAGLASLRYHTTDRNFADKITKALGKLETENYNTGQLLEDLQNFGKSDRENISFLETYL